MGEYSTNNTYQLTIICGEAVVNYSGMWQHVVVISRKTGDITNNKKALAQQKGESKGVYS